MIKSLCSLVCSLIGCIIVTFACVLVACVLTIIPVIVIVMLIAGGLYIFYKIVRN